MKPARPLPWYGGKQGYGKAAWIAGLLPWEYRSTYIEPYAGMASVLLHRRPVACEIINDLDELLINWWRVLREQHDRFSHAVQCIPHSRAEFARALRTRDDPTASPLDRAVAFHTIAMQSAMQNMQNWAIGLSPNVSRASAVAAWDDARVRGLHQRMRHVQLECRPAEILLERSLEVEEAVIYCDPPYVQAADTSSYRVVEVDRDRLTELLLAQQGRVAISGVHDEWDHLGWQRHEREGLRRAVPGEKTQRATPLTEVLWTSYDAAETLPLLQETHDEN